MKTLKEKEHRIGNLDGDIKSGNKWREEVFSKSFENTKYTMKEFLETSKELSTNWEIAIKLLQKAKEDILIKNNAGFEE